MNISSSTLFLLLLAFPQLLQAEIYKYQDTNGKWQFTDKKPKQTDAEVVNYKSNEKEKQGPEFTINQLNDVNYFKVKNPFYAPMNLELNSTQMQKG